MSAATHLVRSEAELNRWMGRLLADPDEGASHFVIGRTRYADLYAMAGCLLAEWDAMGRAPLVCLCAEDKAVVAAALLASLAGGPALVLPYSLSPGVLAEVRVVTGFDHAVVDGPRPLPDGVTALHPTPAESCWPPAMALIPKRTSDEWVRLFTGGSTGTPSMWTKTVRNLLAESIAIVEHYRITAADRMVATVSPNHIYGLLYAILAPLLARAAVAGPAPSFPAEIEAVVDDVDATILISVPAHYRALNGHPWQPRRLRLAFSSAGMLAEVDAHAFHAQTGVRVAEIYGSTETGGIAARVRADGETDFKPYETVAVRIIDERLEVRSDYLSPGLVDARTGSFTMGDRAAAAAGGRFRLLGRADGIVKVGGKRVDLEAVRQALKQQPGVREALVLALPVGRARENQIMALVEGEATVVDLNRALAETLDPYARPRGIKVVDHIPLTAAGKYDRHTIEALFNANEDPAPVDDSQSA
ncbi:AMP-binding protein [Desulfatitalea alkaliphila]|uniref:Long-chain fatty acid--CoA ligase n=1 Tax=Desulfatitalea alkaliphila TaxID=2929485 RepID=A0AA41ULJ6_9BACT|nr:long-chain fatty acid--CoA ligase [Desulfatitalea alkaliphila]MCJ8501586.1 long-chain fatty acid--CoA ligase [Desulfatitalea alkaliphila]